MAAPKLEDLRRHQRQRKTRERQGWAHLSSIWLHGLMLLLLATVGPVQRERTEPPPLQVVRLIAAPAEEAPERTQDADEDDRGEQPDPDQGPADPTDEEELEQLAEADAPGEAAELAEGLDAVSMAAAGEPEPGELPQTDVDDLDALAHVDGPELEEQRPDDPAESVDAPEADPLEPDEAEKVEEKPEPPPEEEEEEEEEDAETRYQRFIRSQQEDASSRPVEAAHIAAVDMDAPERRRAVVEAEQWGPRIPHLDGSFFKPRNKALNLPDGEPVDDVGNRQPVEAVRADAPDAAGGGGDRGERERRTRTGGGLDGQVSGTPTSTARAQQHPSAPAPAMVGAAALQQLSSSGERGFKAAPDGDEQAEDAPAWWQPVAARMTVTPRPRSPEQESPAAVLTEAVEEPAPAVRKPSPKGPIAWQREGADMEVEDEAPAEADIEDEHEETLEGEATETLVETMRDLQEALGVGPNQDRRNQARSNPDVNGQQGTPPSSTQAVLDVEDPFANTVFVRAKADPRGRYSEKLYQLITRAWYALDLPAHEKAIGVQGRVQVTFRVHRDGNISDVRVSKSSGQPVLDAMALEAIPQRAPPFPSEIKVDTLAQQMNFRYRNPLIATSPP